MIDVLVKVARPDIHWMVYGPSGAYIGSIWHKKSRYVCVTGGRKVGDFGLLDPAVEKLLAIAAL